MLIGRAVRRVAQLPARTGYSASIRTGLRQLSSTPKPQEKPVQSPPLIGVNAAIHASNDPSFQPRPMVFDEFSLSDRVAVVSGANRGLGLEMALALCEAGARAVYCLDLPAKPSTEWEHTRNYVKRLANGARLEYVSSDVRDQKGMWEVVEEIGDKERRIDICVAAAGVFKPPKDCLEYPAAEFKEVLEVNTNGVLFTAQAAGRQMVRFGLPGSIILIASSSGTLATKDLGCISYNASKSAVIQMARTMACELGPKRIRVNSLSPGYIYTKTTAAYLKAQPHLSAEGTGPLGRFGRPDELRGVITWLASDASSFCTGSDVLVTGGHHAWYDTNGTEDPGFQSDLE